jgi:hypothetical protein
VTTAVEGSLGLPAAVVAAAMLPGAVIAPTMVPATMVTTRLLAASSLPLARLAIAIHRLALMAMLLALLHWPLVLLARIAQGLSAMLGSGLGSGLGQWLAVTCSSWAVELIVAVGAVGLLRTILGAAIGVDRIAVRPLIEAHATIAAAAATPTTAPAPALAFAAWGLIQSSDGGGVEHFGLGVGSAGCGCGGCGRRLEICNRIWCDQFWFSSGGRRGSRGSRRSGLMAAIRARVGGRLWLRGGCGELGTSTSQNRLERKNQLVLPQSATVVNLMLARQMAQILNRQCGEILLVRHRKTS